MDNGPDISALISSVLQNPEITSIISSISKNKAEEKEEEQDVPPQKADSDTFSIPPEILAKLPKVMSALSGVSGLAASKGSSASPSGKEGQRAALLKALRPYLSERRRSVIDGVLGMEGVAKVIGTLKDT